MHLLICCGTPWELKTVKTQIKNLKLKQKLAIHYLCTGIGNYETIFTLTKFLTEQEDSDFFLVNIGICGYWNRGEQPEKLIQIGRIKNRTTEKELLPPLPIRFAKIESIRSSEKPILEGKEEYGFGEMESRGIELVADKFRLPRLFLKVPFDRVGEETKTFDREKACQMLAENIDYQTLLEQLLSLAP